MTGKMGTVQFFWPSWDGARKEIVREDGKSPVTFTLAYATQCEALYKFMKEATVTWPNYSNGPKGMEGFQTTLLNKNKRKWIDAKIDGWFAKSGIFEDFSPNAVVSHTMGHPTSW